MTRILFVCTANRYRSVIAAACFKDETIRRNQENKWNVLSAGTWTRDGLPAMWDAISSARQIGLNIEDHRSLSITANLIQSADLILVMEQGHKEALQIEFPQSRERIFLLSDAARGLVYDIPDPVKNPAAGNVAGEIKSLIQDGFEKIAGLRV